MAEVGHKPFGTTSLGDPATLFTLRSPALEVDVTDYEATLVGIRSLDKYGRMDDIVAGFPDVTGYCKNQWPKATATSRNGDKKVWHAEVKDSRSIKFTANYSSPFEGNGFRETDISIGYKLRFAALEIEEMSISSHPSVLSGGQRTYFNLSGHECWGGLNEHFLTLFSDSFTDSDASDQAVVAGNIPFSPHKSIQMKPETLESFNVCGLYHGYYRLCDSANRKQVAKVAHRQNGRIFTVEATHPFVSLDTATCFENVWGKKDVCYERHSCFSISSMTRNTLDQCYQAPVTYVDGKYASKQTVWLSFSYDL